MIVVVRPINTINNKSARVTRKVKVRTYPQSGMERMKDWLMEEQWEEVYTAISAHDKAQSFQKLLLSKLNEIFPEKERIFSSDDQPWITAKLKKMDRQVPQKTVS